MNSFTISYAYNHRLSFAPNYVFSKNPLRCKNIKTGRIIKCVEVSRCFGFNINGKFKSLTYLHDYLEIIPKKEYNPFD